MISTDAAIVFSPAAAKGKNRFRGSVIPLSMVRAGQSVKVKYISGIDDTRRFLNNLGFVENAQVDVVSELNGNVIVNVKGTRVAISKIMATRILTA